GRPMLCIYHAAMFMYTNRLEEALAWLQEAERAIDQLESDAHGAPHPAVPPGDTPATLRGKLTQVRGTIARYSGDIPGAVSFARRVPELVPETQASWRAVALVHIAHTFLINGDVQAPQERLAQEMIDAMRAVGNLA